MADDPNRMLTVTLTSDVWDHLCDRLGDYADQAEERPWLGDCLDCDKADPGMCPQHQQAAEYGAQVRSWRDQIVDQLADQLATTADLVRRTGLPLDTELGHLPMSFALRNLLGREGIFTLGDLAPYSDDALNGIRQFGPARLRELRAVLSRAAENS
ncbi:DNA-directed RNA polymerase subunit alpha C-terminal domain-containing protein [Nonomuraea sp. B19D2]|uniref:DNA-directed RNA polymerase subunit alpha C-terminal domain-containing protein n=1 Tax=Nonomuraea sp. B19D2 TaxID=3159561 RepID=UPI0032D9FF03